MRTTFDIPDDLYRSLKARAALRGLKLRELVTRYLEEGARVDALPQAPREREAPPVMIPATGRRIPALGNAEIADLLGDDSGPPDARS